MKVIKHHQKSEIEAIKIEELSLVQLPRKRVINISQEVWDAIAKQAIPLVDTPDSVLRRIFGLAPKK